MKNDNALSTSECFRLCAEMRISLMALMVSRNCVGVSFKYVSGAATRIESNEDPPDPRTLTGIRARTAGALLQSSHALSEQFLEDGGDQSGRQAGCRTPRLVVEGRSNMTSMARAVLTA